MISKDLLEIMACPHCRARVIQDGSAIQCTNVECRRRYPIRDQIPVMLVSEAEQIDKEDFARKMKNAAG